eukprot:Gb_07551 [translate_table: standard]
MEATKSGFQRFQPRADKLKAALGKKKESDNGKEGPKPATDEAPSNITKKKVATAKQYIENHYKAQMKSLQERKERRWILECKLADAEVSEEEQNNLLKCRGKFGEVRLCREKTTGHVYAMKKLKKS